MRPLHGAIIDCDSGDFENRDPSMSLSQSVAVRSSRNWTLKRSMDPPELTAEPELRERPRIPDFADQATLEIDDSLPVCDASCSASAFPQTQAQQF